MAHWLAAILADEVHFRAAAYNRTRTRCAGLGCELSVMTCGPRLLKQPLAMQASGPIFGESETSTRGFPNSPLEAKHILTCHAAASVPAKALKQRNVEPALIHTELGGF